MNELPKPMTANALLPVGGEVHVGRIVSVTGGNAVVLLDPPEHQLVFGQSKSPEIGTLLKFDSHKTASLAMISALSAPMPSYNVDEQELRIAEVEFIGELPKGPNGELKSFRRGISTYPSLGDSAWRANTQELAMAYACDDATGVRVGYIHQDSSIPAMIKIDEMLGKHFAVLGTTGTGKSNSVALILRRILEKSPQGHVVLLDLHREYAKAFPGVAEIINQDNMVLPFWLLNFEEVSEILVGPQSGREADIEVLRELIPQAKQRYLTNQRRDHAGNLRAPKPGELLNPGVDSPVPYRTSDLMSLIEEYMGKLELKGELAPYKRLKSRLDLITRDPRYAFMFGGLTVLDTMVQVISRMFRVPVNGKPLAILELGGLPSEIVNVVVSVLARLAFDFAMWSGGRVPITFVCEEAHRYAPSDKALGFEPTKRAISRIAKEGRKYGISLCIISQRPAELDPTILSQCNTIFSLRLTNERDQNILRSGISDSAASLLEFMGTMGVGEAIIFGEGVALPTRIKFDALPFDEQPRSQTASFTESWARELPDDSFLTETVNRWRAQSHNPDSTGYSVEAVIEPPEPPPAERPPMGLRRAEPAPAAPPPGLRKNPGGFGGAGR